MLVGLFKTLCLILGIYFIGKVVSRIFLPLFFQGMVKKASDQMRQQQDEMLRQAKRKNDGDVTVNYQPKSNKNFGKEEGDYIDFEEVK